MAFKLPRLERTTELVTTTRFPTQVFQIWWDRVATSIEDAVFNLAETLSRLTNAEISIDALSTRTLTAGQGLTGGGNLSADRTFNVGAGVGISVSTDQVRNTGVLSFSGGATGLTPAVATNGAIVLDGALNLTHGGHGATTASGARTNLGLAIGTDVQAFSANLSAYAGGSTPSAFTLGIVNSANAAAFRTAIGAGTGGGSVTSVAALTIGTSGTNITSSVANGTTTPVITLNVPDASASNRGALTAADFVTFNSKQAALVSGTNIKTVGGVTLLGAGDVSAPTFSTVTNSGAPGSTFVSDVTAAAVSLINGATVDFPNFAGSIVISDNAVGAVGLYLVGAGAVSVLGPTTAMGGTVTYVPGINGYRFTNTSGGTRTFSFAATKMRSAA